MREPVSNQREMCQDFLPVRHSVVVLHPDNSASQSFKDSQIDMLKQGAQFLRSHKNRRVVIEGHTFPLGNKQIEKSRGKETALFAKNFLILHGVQDEQIEVASRGASKLRFDPDESQENYRLEMDYLELSPINCPEPVP